METLSPMTVKPEENVEIKNEGKKREEEAMYYDFQ